MNRLASDSAVSAHAVGAGKWRVDMAWSKILFYGLSGCILMLILMLLYSASQASIRHHGKLYSLLFFLNYSPLERTWSVRC